MYCSCHTIIDNLKIGRKSKLKGPLAIKYHVFLLEVKRKRKRDQFQAFSQFLSFIKIEIKLKQSKIKFLLFIRLSFSTILHERLIFFMPSNQNLDFFDVETARLTLL